MVERDSRRGDLLICAIMFATSGPIGGLIESGDEERQSSPLTMIVSSSSSVGGIVDDVRFS